MHNTHAEFVGLQIDCLAAMKRQSLKSVRKKASLRRKKTTICNQLSYFGKTKETTLIDVLECRPFKINKIDLTKEVSSEKILILNLFQPNKFFFLHFIEYVLISKLIYGGTKTKKLFDSLWYYDKYIMHVWYTIENWCDFTPNFENIGSKL